MISCQYRARLQWQLQGLTEMSFNRMFNLKTHKLNFGIEGERKLDTKDTLQDRIDFDALTGLWSIMDMAYYSYVLYVFQQKIDWHEVSDRYIVHRNN